MHYNQSWAEKGNRFAEGAQHHRRGMQFRSMQRAAVNIFKTENSYEIMVFAPGRIKEHFHIEVKGSQLHISYLPPEGFPRPDWVLREYSRGAFERVFEMDAVLDTEKIAAKYLDGVLQVSIPVKEGEQKEKRSVVVE